MKKDSHNFYCGGVQHWHEDVALKSQQRWTDGCWWLIAAWCKSDLCFSSNLTMTSLMTGALAKCGFEEEKSFSWDCQSHISTHFFFYGTIFSIPCSGLHLQLLKDSSGVASRTGYPSGNPDGTGCKCWQSNTKALCIIRTQIQVRNFL